MDAQTRMKIVDDLFSEISQKIGVLTNQGVFTFVEASKIIRAISDKETEWMQSKFSDMEIYEFMRNNPVKWGNYGKKIFKWPWSRR